MCKLPRVQQSTQWHYYLFDLWIDVGTIIPTLIQQIQIQTNPTFLKHQPKRSTQKCYYNGTRRQWWRHRSKRQTMVGNHGRSPCFGSVGFFIEFGNPKNLGEKRERTSIQL